MPLEGIENPDRLRLVELLPRVDVAPQQHPSEVDPVVSGQAEFLRQQMCLSPSSLGCPHGWGHEVVSYAPIAKHVTLGEGMEALPVYIRRAHGHDRTWREQAQCAKPNVVTEWLGQDQLPERDEEIQRRRVWNIDSTGPRKVELAGVMVEAAAVEDLASMICNSCPAQYDCAIYAIMACESAGTWGMRNDWLRVLQALGETEAIAFVEEARADGVKIQGRVKRRLLARGNTSR